ncbi:MAG: 16S rRNA processing protein RimM [Clostridia bacterium]|nr:16S rRNA processing protein RimM [Clostridia bacterium]
MRKYIEIGKITRPHGINGAVKSEPWCDSPSVLASLKKIYLADKKSEVGFSEKKILKASVQKDRVILLIEGIESPEAAERLRDTLIYADRGDIPLEDGAFLIDDLKGLDVIDISNGKIYGKLNDVLQGAAGDLYEINTEAGTVLIPAVKEFIKEINLEKGIFISPIEGMFDDN